MSENKRPVTQNAKYIMMTTQPVEKLVCKMSIPTIISMLVTALYNMADTFFVGQIDTTATAGVGLIFPIMSIIQAFGFFFGQGSGNFISRQLGARKRDQAEIMASTGNLSALFFGLLILLFGTVFMEPLLQVLGADETRVQHQTVVYARDYLRVILFGAPFMCMSCVLNNQMRFQGNAVFSMIGLVSGAVVNCILDPLFILVFKMEVIGAALATAISQCLSCAILYVGTLRSDSLKIRLCNFRPTLYYYKQIAIGGAPSLFRQGLASVATLCLNSAAGSAAAAQVTEAIAQAEGFSSLAEAAKIHADAAVAAFSVVGKVMMFAFSALLGFGQGFQPVCGFNYGARKYGRVCRAYTFCLKVGVIVLFTLALLGFVFAQPVVRVFRDDPLVTSYAAIAMRCQCCTFVLMSLVTLTNMLYQNIGRVVGATLLAVARQGLMFIPVVLILPAMFEQPIWGVYLAQPLADLFAFILAVPLAVSMYKELKRQQFAEDLDMSVADLTSD